ncbi:MAG: SIS domain-containing protein [Candidatus Pacebacteria bacterium]|nr:SIS domain-containing protein [Candidatus Paceibacterota bacterium]
MKDQKIQDPNLLEDIEKIRQVDPDNVLGSIQALADQIHHAWKDTKQIEFKLKHKITNVVIAGMGGSGLGGDVIKNLFKTELKTPFEVVNSYFLPGYVDKNTLVVLSSYSGNTEEVVNCAAQIKDKKAQAVVITAGGKLLKLANKNNWPTYQIDPQHNPSNQPRMAIGYAIFGLMGLLNQAKVIKLKKADLEEASKAILATAEDCQVEIPAEKNPAKTLAFNCIDRRPILVAAEFLIGAVHTSTNQFNENSKTFADYKVIPEINHHLLEALDNPISNPLDHLFLFFNSELYFERNQQRMRLTQQAVNKKDFENLSIKLEAQTKIGQVFELITLMAYANFYLAILYGIDPSEIPMVDWFKAQLKK